MEAVTSKTSNESVTTQTSTEKSTGTFDLKSLLEKDFETVLKSTMGGDAKNQVNEEEVFSALVEQQLAGVDPSAQETFQSQKQAYMSSMARADGYVNIEDVTNAALRGVVSEGKVDEATASQIKSYAFRAAQLDDNLTALYDSRGSESDPTIAVDSMESALTKANDIMTKIASGEITVDPASLSESAAAGSSTSGTAADGSGGFLWKPESERDGNLAILLPAELAGAIDRLEIHSELPPTDATKIGEGNYSGETNGDRPTFRFDKSGAEFGDNVHVVVYKDDGSYVTYDIPNGGQRVD